MILKKTILLGIAMLAAPLFTASDAEAGPLLDWLRGRRATSNFQQPFAFNTQNQVTAGFAPQAQNAFGLQPGQCMKTCQKTCSRTVVNYVPYTAYRTSWKRVPVTSYRPVTNSDPCTGCTVTCMRPCTTYTYQMQRVPYTTQRPVYRTETFKVPVTTITNDCATGGCNTGCDTCSTGFQGAPVQQGFAPTTQGFAPTPASPQFESVPSTGSSTRYFDTPVFPSQQPSSIAPSLQGSQSRNVVPSGTLTTNATYEVASKRSPRTSQRPEVSIPRNLKTLETRSAKSPVQRDWNYSPVRLASFEKPVAARKVPVRSVRKKAAPRRNIREINSLWNDVK